MLLCSFRQLLIGENKIRVYIYIYILFVGGRQLVSFWNLLVLDDFELSQLGKDGKSISDLREDTRFSKKITFYTSDRVDGASYITDCVVESILTQEELNSFDYSDTMVKFVVERYLKLQNVNGTFMNLYKNGTPKYRKPVVKHVKRLIIEKDNNLYKDTKNVKFKMQDTNEYKPKGTPLSRYYTALR